MYMYMYKYAYVYVYKTLGVELRPSCKAAAVATTPREGTLSAFVEQVCRRAGLEIV